MITYNYNGVSIAEQREEAKKRKRLEMHNKACAKGKKKRNKLKKYKQRLSI